MNMDTWIERYDCGYALGGKKVQVIKLHCLGPPRKSCSIKGLFVWTRNEVFLLKFFRATNSSIYPHNFCLKILTVNGIDLRLFWAKTFPLLYLTIYVGHLI